MTKPKTKIPRFPVQEWLGKYEGWWLTMYGKKGFISTCRLLETFFGYYQAYPGLEYFTIAEVNDYFEWRLANGAKMLRMNFEMYAIRKFWRWLTEDNNLPLTNPVRRGVLQKVYRSLHPLKTPVQIPPPVLTNNYDTSSWDFGVLQE